MSNVVGHILPANASFMGKAITAFQTEERREKLLRSHEIYRFTDHTVVDRSHLLLCYVSTRSSILWSAL
jgi:IclR family acetate operon transcriptional repressor